MLDVLFIEPNSSNVYGELAEDYAAIETPTWALLLAESCRSRGYKVGILDANALRLHPAEVAAAVTSRRPKLVCFVVYGQNPNSGTTNMSGAIREAERVKHYNMDATIAFVGSHISALPRETMEKHKCIDIGIIGEGVYALHQLAECHEARAFIDGIIWRKPSNGELVINGPGKLVPQDRMSIDLPGYAWDLLPYDKKPLDLYRCHTWHNNFGDDRSPFAAIYTSLGCKFKCSFCMINIVNRTDYSDGVAADQSNIMRYWPAETVKGWFDELEEMGVKNVRFSDEMFFLIKDHFEPIVEDLIKSERS